MDAPTAAVIGSVCTLVLGLITLRTQLILAERVRATHDLVNSMAAKREVSIHDQAFTAGIHAAHELGAIPPAKPES